MTAALDKALSKISPEPVEPASLDRREYWQGPTFDTYDPSVASQRDPSR